MGTTRNEVLQDIDRNGINLDARESEIAQELGLILNPVEGNATRFRLTPGQSIRTSRNAAGRRPIGGKFGAIEDMVAEGNLTGEQTANLRSEYLGGYKIKC